MSDAQGLPSPAEVNPVLVGRHTRVRPVLPSDYDWLYRVAVLSPAGSRWRLHGDVPNFENFIRFVFEGARATCLIEDTGGNPLGLVQAWRVDTMSQHCQVTAFLAPEAEGKAWPLEGIMLFVDYAFRAFDLNKIYVETLETELNSYRSLVGTVLVQEGRFHQHKKLFGRWVDGYMLAIYRPAFDAFFARTVGRARRAPAPNPTPMPDGDDAIVAG